MIADVFAAFLIAYAITDYLSLTVEIIVSGAFVLVAAYYYLPMASLVPIASLLFALTIIFMVLQSRWTFVTTILMIIAAFYYMVELKNGRVSGLLWLYIGLAFGIMDNYVIGHTAPGDILITIVLFLAAGPLALPVYIAQAPIGALFLSREEMGQEVYPMGTAVFIAYLSVAWMLKYIHQVWPWLIQ